MRGVGGGGGRGGVRYNIEENEGGGGEGGESDYIHVDLTINHHYICFILYTLITRQV